MTIKARMKPGSVTVNEPCRIEIKLTTDTALEEGDTIEFQFPHSWSLVSGPSFTRDFQTEDPEGEHYVSVNAKGAEFTVTCTPYHKWKPEGPARHGRRFTATISQGAVTARKPIVISYANTIAPYTAEKDEVFLTVKGEQPKSLPSITVNPGPAVHTRIIVPSSTEPGKEFDVLIVSLDEFDNCSNSVYEELPLTLQNGEIVVEQLSVDGFARVTVAIEETGIYRFIYGGSAVSNAIRISETAKGPYWGDIHIHTDISHDAKGNDPFGYARGVSGLDFAAACDHCESHGEAGYKEMAARADKANKPGEFVALYADERNPKAATGHHNIYYRTKDALERFQVPEAQDGKVDNNAFLDELPAEDVMLFPHHTGITWGNLPEKGIGTAVDWGALGDRDYRPVMEIYSHHGQSELWDPQHILAYEFNRMRNPERRSNVSMPGPFYAQDYLRKGIRIGFIGSSDEHAGQGGRRHGGIAAVFADELTRDGIFNGIRNRQCYATTGERILIDFSINGTAMGNSCSCPSGTEVEIDLAVWGTDRLLRVEVLRCAPEEDQSFYTILSETPRPESVDAAYRFKDTVSSNTIYYARITQDPLEWPGMAWSSPVWVDIEG